MLLPTSDFRLPTSDFRLPTSEAFRVSRREPLLFPAILLEWRQQSPDKRPVNQALSPLSDKQVVHGHY